MPYSIIGRSNFEEFLRRNVAEKTLLYINKEKSQELETQSQLQLLRELKAFDFNTIIKESKNVVKRSESPDSSVRASIAADLDEPYMAAVNSGNIELY